MIRPPVATRPTSGVKSTASPVNTATIAIAKQAYPVREARLVHNAMTARR